MLRRRLIGCALVLAGASSPTLAGADAPQWMRDAAATGTIDYGPKVTAVVLLNEQRAKIGDDGRIIATTRYAVRILTREGRGFAAAGALYTPDTGKVRELRAWLIRPSGEVREYGKDRTIDLAVGGLEEYSEVRRKWITAEGDADARDIFGYECTTEDRSVFTQFEWHFQARLPVVLSRYSLELPNDWRAESVTFNHRKIEPIVTGAIHSWELQNLPAIESEPASPAVTHLAPRLAVSVLATKGGGGPSFNGWRDVSRWLSELSDPQTTASDEITAKARSLTAGATTELDRIREIGRYAQRIRYVSIQTGIGRGGGYRPRAASDVFSKGYGDCKDKANLMRTMLKTLGMTAYPVAIYSGDSTYVRDEWASPQQFNHCIIAVRISDATKALSTVEHPQLGRLLIFDPTDEDTQIGDLPEDEQGSLALLVAGESGALMRMPKLAADVNRLEREVTATLREDGALTATIRELSTGQEAASERRDFRTSNSSEYRKTIEQWITRGATGAQVAKIDASDESADGRFKLQVEFTAPRYAQPTGKLLLFKPAIVARREGVYLNEKTRKHAVVLGAVSWVENTRFTLPAGFVVDESPESVELKLSDGAKVDSPFSAYTASCKAREAELVCTRRLEQRASTLPVERYEELQKFLERIRSAELAPVVLMKK